MSRALPVLVELGLLIYCLIDCIQTPEGAERNLPKLVWILLILLVPIVGPVAWLVAGRPQRNVAHGRVAGFPEYQRDQWGSRGTSAPDDDPEFLRQLGQVSSEHEQTLKQWEDDLRRREAELRKYREEPPGEPPPA